MVFIRYGTNTREKLARRFIERGHRAILSCVDTQQIDAAFCGRDFSCVNCSPIFRRRAIRAEKTANFTRAFMQARYLPNRFRLMRGERVLRDGRFQYVDLIETDVLAQTGAVRQAK